MLAKVSSISLARSHLLSQQRIKPILDILPGSHLENIDVIVKAPEIWVVCLGWKKADEGVTEFWVLLCE